MQIDWLTVTAQILNFLVLAWLLKRFLYRPVIDAMTQREQRIATRLAQAAQREAQAQAEARTYSDKVAAFDRDRQAQLAQAREAAEHERRSLLESARGEAGPAASAGSRNSSASRTTSVRRWCANSPRRRSMSRGAR